MLDQIFLSPQVKRIVIISNKQLVISNIGVASQDLNNLRLRITGKKEISEKSQDFIEL